MGDPIKLRKKYYTPGHPWKKERIEFEKELSKRYALKNKKEIWKASSILRNFTKQAKTLIVRDDEQAEKERRNLINKIKSLGLAGENPTVDDILALNVEDILARRLQSVVYKRQLAKSMKQARQFVVHNHITVNGVVVTSPSYLVKVDDVVEFSPSSPLANDEHPERYHEEEKKDDEKKDKPKKKDSEEEPELINPDEVEDNE